jgi:hypothetical protein
MRINFYLGGRAGPVTDVAQRYHSLAVAGRRPGTAAGRYGPAAGRDGPAAGRDGPAAGWDGPAAGRDGPAAGRDGTANEQASPATRASQVGSSGIGGRTRALRRLYNKVVGQVIDTKVDNKSRRCLKIMIMHIKKKAGIRIMFTSVWRVCTVAKKYE